LEDEHSNNFTTITGPKAYRNGQAVSNPTKPATHRQEDAHTILALMCQAEQEYRRDKQTERFAQGRETSLSGRHGRNYL